MAITLQQVEPPRVEEAAVQLECKLRHTYDVKNRCCCFCKAATMQ